MTPRECLKLNDGSVPRECYALRTAFFECKRSIVSLCNCIYIGFKYVNQFQLLNKPFGLFTVGQSSSIQGT